MLSDPSTKLEAYFEGADNVFEGAEVNFNSKQIALREIGATNKHAYTNSQIAGHGVTKPWLVNPVISEVAFVTVVTVLAVSVTV